jgi:hypothetical protein
MSVARCQGVVTAYSAGAGKLGSSALRAGSSLTSARASASPESSEGSPAVINGVDQEVYSAVDEFLTLPGDERLEAYAELSDAGKRKFSKILSKLVDDGYADSSKLDLGERTPAKQAFLEDYSSASDNTASPYSSDGRIAS